MQDAADENFVAGNVIRIADVRKKEEGRRKRRRITNDNCQLRGRARGHRPYLRGRARGHRPYLRGRARGHRPYLWTLNYQLPTINYQLKKLLLSQRYSLRHGFIQGFC
ncbi:MAG: hypothetical protein ACRC62_16385 [Microcoleus sp.]